MPPITRGRPAIAELQTRRRQFNRQQCSTIAAVVAPIVTASVHFHQSLHNHCSQHDSRLQGASWMRELLNNHPDRIKNNLGVSQSSFTYISGLLQRKSSFCDSQGISSDKQLGIFLFAVGTNVSMRRIAERFQRSTSTIHLVYHRVTQFLVDPAIYDSVICPAIATAPIADQITNNSSFFPHFKNCISAVNGTHILVSPTNCDKSLWRNRKGYTSQNALAICNFDMYFTNVMYGWEGSVADSTLWLQANRSAIVDIPDKKYVPGGAGFTNCSICMVPFSNVRYHLQEWGCGNHAPQDAKELFNMRHSQ